MWADPDRQPRGSHHLELDSKCIWLGAGCAQVCQTAGNQGSSPVTNGPQCTLSTMTLQYQPLSDRCIPSEWAMPDSVGYNLFMPIDFRIKPKARKVIFLDYVLGIPEGNYRRIVSKLGLALNYSIDVKAGVVDRGYQGNIGVILKNNSEIPFQWKRGQPIAQLILEKSDTSLV